MAAENATAYSKTDVESRLTVASSTEVDFTNMERDDTCYVSFDKGAGFASGDYTVLLNVRVNSADTDGGFVLWCFSGSLGNKSTMDAGTSIYLFTGGTSSGTLFMREFVGGVQQNSDSWPSFSLSTDYYLTITRVGTTMTAKVYTDSGRTTLVKTLTFTLSTTSSYRYSYWLANFGTTPTDTAKISGYVKSLDITIPSVIKTVDNVAKASVKTFNGVAIASVKTINGIS